MSLYEYLNEHGNDLDNHDLAVLADWANETKRITPNEDWKRAYALIREGADLLLRRRARASILLKEPLNDPNPAIGKSIDYFELRKQIGDWVSTYYGPHACSKCGEMIIKQAIEQGGREFSSSTINGNYVEHYCNPRGLPIGYSNIGCTATGYTATDAKLHK